MGSIVPRVLLWCVLAGSVWCVAAESAHGQKPVKEHTSHPDFIAPPSSLNETVLATPLIVRGRILGSGPRDTGQVGNPGTWIRTAHRLQVIETLHSPPDAELGDEITVVQTGGERDRGTHVERLNVNRFPLLQPGKEYVLFLEPAYGDAWGSAYGPDGVFEKVGERVAPLGTSPTSVRQRDLSWAEFLTVVRNFGIQKGNR